MNSAHGAVRQLLPSDLVLLALVFAIPIMKPAVTGPVIAADLLFVIMVVVAGVEVVVGLRRVRWVSGFGPLLAYAAGLSCSLLVTSDLGASAFKLATEFYLVGLAAMVGWLVDSEAKLRRLVLVWLAATALTCVVALLSLLAFVAGREAWLLDYSSFGFGSLPQGNYPRLALTFFNANMACNYLTVGLSLTFLSRHFDYIGRTAYWLLLAGIAIASIATISPGLGGVFLMASLWIWFAASNRSPAVARAVLAFGVLIAALFVIALALTPFPHATATFMIHLPGGITFYPAPRLLIWIAAWKQFVSHPILGIGLGIDPVHVGFASPSGYEVLTDAHNVFLSIAAQCGIAGLIGLGAIVRFALVQTPSPKAQGKGTIPRFLLGASFLDAFVYQGIGGSFEDTRHIWLFLGLMIAASRIDFTRADENNRRVGAPSPC